MVVRQYSVRPARAEDASAICAIYNEGIDDRATLETERRTVDERRSWLAARDARHPVVVVESDGVVIGWASLNVFNARDAVEERDERQPALLVPVDRVKRLHKDVRREVLGVVRRSRAREAVAVDRVSVSLVELTERRGVPGLCGANQRSIGSGFTSCQVDRARPAYCHVSVALLHLTKGRGNPFTQRHRLDARGAIRGA